MGVQEDDTGESSIPKQQTCNDGRVSYAFSMGFGERLRIARNAAKKTGETLGHALAVSKATISHWEKDRYEPSIEQLIALCAELNVSADWLLEREHQGLSPDALEEARAYDRLSPEDRRRWRVMRQTLFSGAREDAR